MIMLGHHHGRLILILIYLLTAVGLTLGGSSTVHIYTQTIHRTTQKYNWNSVGRAPSWRVIPLQLRKKYGKTSVRVAEQ
jgi:hypothetical protein